MRRQHLKELRKDVTHKIQSSKFKPDLGGSFVTFNSIQISAFMLALHLILDIQLPVLPDMSQTPNIKPPDYITRNHPYRAKVSALEPLKYLSNNSEMCLSQSTVHLPLLWDCEHLSLSSVSLRTREKKASSQHLSNETDKSTPKCARSREHVLQQ